MAVGMQEWNGLSQSHQMRSEIFRTFRISQEWVSGAQCIHNGYYLSKLHFIILIQLQATSDFQLDTNIFSVAIVLNPLFETFSPYRFFFSVMTNQW